MFIIRHFIKTWDYIYQMIVPSRRSEVDSKCCRLLFSQEKKLKTKISNSPNPVLGGQTDAS